MADEVLALYTANPFQPPKVDEVALQLKQTEREVQKVVHLFNEQQVLVYLGQDASISIMRRSRRPDAAASSTFRARATAPWRASSSST